MITNAVDKSPGRHFSPRTIEQPMAFTGKEFFRGALAALILITVVIPVVFLIIGTVSGLIAGNLDAMGYYVFLLVVINTLFPLAVLLVGCVVIPISFMLGYAIRRVRRLWVHLTLFFIVGQMIGISLVIIWAQRFIRTEPVQLPERAGIHHAVEPVSEPLLSYWDQLMAWLPAMLLVGTVSGIVAVLSWGCTARKALRDDQKYSPLQNPIR